MPATFIHYYWFDSVLVLLFLVALLFLLNRLGLMAWLRWAGRKPSIQDSSERKYWSAHE